MAQVQLPPIPETPQREGSRWRHHRPSGEEVAEWFRSQPLDEGMPHDHYIGGVVLIPQSGKEKHRLPDGNRVERYEDTWTPYMQTGTRIAYLRRLAEYRELVHVIEPVEVPRITDRTSAFYNGNMEAGYWWHIVTGDSGAERFLCCTMRVALYEPTTYGRLIRGEPATPVLEGRSTKQVGGYPDINQLAKAQTGAIGRALGIAGILTLGTGVATAEDMQELAGAGGVVPLGEPELPAGPPQGPALPATDPAEELTRLRAEALALQEQLKPVPAAWQQFVAWWKERAAAESWTSLSDVPRDSLKGVIVMMERIASTAAAAGQETGDESPLPPNEPTQAGA